MHKFAEPPSPVRVSMLPFKHFGNCVQCTNLIPSTHHLRWRNNRLLSQLDQKFRGLREENIIPFVVEQRHWLRFIFCSMFWTTSRFSRRLVTKFISLRKKLKIFGLTLAATTLETFTGSTFEPILTSSSSPLLSITTSFTCDCVGLISRKFQTRSCSACRSSKSLGCTKQEFTFISKRTLLTNNG